VLLERRNVDEVATDWRPELTVQVHISQ
jgi:hypothetical protein